MHLTLPDMRADTAQLIRLLVESHPDPYAAGGGPVAFHRRADALLAALPEAGLSAAQFQHRLRPLVAAVGDGHTTLLPLATPADAAPQARFAWEVVEDQLYIGAVRTSADRPLLGAQLTALAGVAVTALASRLLQRRACDNDYQVLAQLALALDECASVADLLDTVALPDDVPLTLTLPDGTHHTTALRWEMPGPAAPLAPESAHTPPTLNAARLGWSFLAEDRAVAWLRIASLRHYREAFEVARSSGFAGVAAERLRAIAREVADGAPPATPEEQLALVPAATALLRDLFVAMRAARTSALLVDLRECDGGNSLFAAILGYFLHGGDTLLRAERGYQVKRYSPLYFANYRRADPAAHAAALRNGGYDFAEEHAWRARQGHTGAPTVAEREEWRQQVAQAPTFAREHAARTHEAHWTPRVIVLTSARTYSAGFDVVATLLRQGAAVIGVPSAQAGNCFIDVLRFRLDHSGLEGWVSFKWSQLFPSEPERGRVLRPDRELTYADLAARHFDPHEIGRAHV